MAKFQAPVWFSVGGWNVLCNQVVPESSTDANWGSSAEKLHAKPTSCSLTASLPGGRVVGRVCYKHIR